MSRVVKNVIVWVLVLAVILCIIAGFTFGLSSVSGVADAMEATLPDNGIINPNLFSDGYYTDMGNPLNLDLGVTSLNQWYAFSSTIVSLNDGYVNYLRENNSYGVALLSQSITGLIPGDTYTVSFYARVNSDTPKLSVNVRYEYGDNSSITTGFNFSVSSHDFVLYSRTFTADSTRYTGGTVDFSFTLGNNYNGDVDFCYIKLESGSDFTGFAVDSNGSYDDGYEAGVADGTQTGYDEGYEAGVADGTQTGYDDGYEVGFNDGLVSVNDVFVCSAVDIEYDSSKNYIYFNPNDVYTSYSNVMVNSFAMAFVPLSCLRYDEVDGGFYPVDIVRNSEGELPDVGTSAYYMRFQSLLEVGQWLLDNPNDYLCSYAISGGPEPAAIIFADLSFLESFMNGASVSYDYGYDDGYDVGYNAGDGAGYNRGYGVGFNDGQRDASSGNYTFLALIGSVLDAPITAFKGLLDFELLGVNMSSFVLAIMSLCVIIVIIRLVLR